MTPVQPEKQTNLLWKVLGGDYFGHVTLNNLRMFLLAVKGLHVQPDVRLETDKCYRLNEKMETHKHNFEYLGIFNSSRDMYLFKDDI